MADPQATSDRAAPTFPLDYGFNGPSALPPQNRCPMCGDPLGLVIDPRRCDRCGNEATR